MVDHAELANEVNRRAVLHNVVLLNNGDGGQGYSARHSVVSESAIACEDCSEESRPITCRGSSSSSELELKQPTPAQISR